MAAEVRTWAVFQDALRQALRGGLSGGCAQSLNVVLLMWCNTIMNFQYRHGGTFSNVARHLYAEGGILRFYRGLAPALISAPLGRFGDVAANEGMMIALEGSNVSLPLRTLAGSACACLFRIVVMPFDAWKTTKQVEGSRGLEHLIAKTRQDPFTPWRGSMGAIAATAVSHYPWFLTNNVLRQQMPHFDFPMGNHVRYAMIGFASSAVSDICSNSLRVLKTTRQTSLDKVGYVQVAQEIIQKDGYIGFFGRGLKTRILAKGIQGAVFTVGWRAIQDSL